MEPGESARDGIQASHISYTKMDLPDISYKLQICTKLENDVIHTITKMGRQATLVNNLSEGGEAMKEAEKKLGAKMI